MRMQREQRNVEGAELRESGMKTAVSEVTEEGGYRIYFVLLVRKCIHNKSGRTEQNRQACTDRRALCKYIHTTPSFITVL